MFNVTVNSGPSLSMEKPISSDASSSEMLVTTQLGFELPNVAVTIANSFYSEACANTVKSGAISVVESGPQTVLMEKPVIVKVGLNSSAVPSTPSEPPKLYTMMLYS